MRDISWSEIFDRIIIPSIANTLEMLFFCFIFSSILGFTVAVALYMTQPGGLRENKAIYSILNGGISILRSFPFMILMVSIIPLTRIITGSSIGWVSALIPLTFASTPFMARMIENSIKEVNPALVDAAKSFGASDWQIIFGVVLSEALPSLITGSIFLVISAVINVVLDIVFVLQFHTGVVGCAYATVISQGISALLCLIYMIKKYEILHLHREDMKFSWYSAVQMLNLGVPMGLQFSITAIGTIIVQGAINVFGEAHIAGFSAANKVQNVCTTMFAAFGATIATYTGQNLGAGRMDRVREGVKVTLKTLLVFSVVIAIIISVFGVQIARLFVGGLDTEVLGAARNYFQAVIWFYPFLACIFLYRNTLQGLGYGLVPMLGGVSELFARGMVVVVLARFGKFFLVCLADPAAWIFALLPIVPYYYYISKKVLTNEYK